MLAQTTPFRVASSLLLVLALVACAPSAEETERTTPSVVSATGDVASIDDRTPIRVDPSTRFLVLNEMRAMLIAVQGIVGGAGRGDTAAMRTMAAAVGLAAATEADATVANQLGATFVQLGMLTHANFDSLASDVAKGKNREAVLTRLSTIMGNCVGCHTKFRLVTEP